MAKRIEDLAGEVAKLTPEERRELLRLVGPLLLPEDLDLQARVRRQRAALARTSGMITEVPPGPHSTTVDEVLYGPKAPSGNEPASA